MKATAHITKVAFEVAETLVVSDPCYLRKPDFDLEWAAPAPGLWAAEIEHENDGLGRVVSLLRLYRGALSLELERVGNVGVDSGRMYAGCLTDLPLDYDAFIVTMREQGYPDCTVFGGGVVCSSGYGDGLYPVYADRDWTVVEVRFMEDPEE